VEIYNGPYFVHLGDFGTSGAMNIITKKDDKDSTLTLSGGSYNTQRYMGILSAPEGTPLRPFIAGEFYHNDGPFKSENNYSRYNLLAKFGLLSTANSNLNFLGTFYKTAWDASGELPVRAVRSGEIGRFGSFDPSEGGKSERQNLSLLYNYTDANQSFNAQTWVSWYQLQLWSNFSLFLNDEVNGDGIEQRDKRFLAGNNINYRRAYNLWGLPMESFIGSQSRLDHIRVGLFNQTNRRRRETVKNNYIDQTNLGGSRSRRFVRPRGCERRSAHAWTISGLTSIKSVRFSNPSPARVQRLSSTPNLILSSHRSPIATLPKGLICF
jgi:hypothetical protein